MAETLSFGNWIRQRRRALDLTQEQLAANIGCSLSAIRKIEADERRPSRQVAELLADTLVVPAGDRAVFLRVARLELGFERLGAIAEPTLALPNALPANANGGSRPALPLLSLPKPPTPLVGREIEIARIVEILSSPECRLLTLAGPGGIGKTRLAIAAAETLGRALAGGACFVPLAAVTTPESIWPAIASALGLHLRGATTRRHSSRGSCSQDAFFLCWTTLSICWREQASLPNYCRSLREYACWLRHASASACRASGCLTSMGSACHHGRQEIASHCLPTGNRRAPWCCSYKPPAAPNRPILWQGQTTAPLRKSARWSKGVSGNRVGGSMGIDVELHRDRR